MTILITGPVILPDGNLFINSDILIRRKGPVIAQGGVLLPDEFTTRTSVSGQVSFEIEPGEYEAFANAQRESRIRWDFNVPETPASRTFASCVAAGIPYITPDLVAQAEAAAAAAAASAAESEADADRAELAASELLLITTPRYETYAELLSATVASNTITVYGTTFQEHPNGFALDATGKKFGPIEYVSPAMFGALHDGINDDRTAMLAANVWGAANGVEVLGRGGEYVASEAVYLDTNLKWDGEGCVIYPIAYPDVGGFITNVWKTGEVPDADLRRTQRNVRAVNIEVNCERLPYPVTKYAYSKQSTNALLFQSTFTNAAWVATGSIAVAGLVLGPDRLTPMMEIRETAVTSAHSLSQSVTQAYQGDSSTDVYALENVAIGKEVVFSVYLQAAGRTKPYISTTGSAYGATESIALFDMTTKTVTSSGSGILIADIRDAGNGIYQIMCSRVATATGSATMSFGFADAAGTVSFLGVDGLIAGRACLARVEFHTNRNTNCFGQARGMYDSYFGNLVARRVRGGAGGGTGGGGFGNELGAHNITWENCVAIECFRGFRTNGNSGVWPTGEPATVTNIKYINCSAFRCDAATVENAIGTEPSPGAAPDLGGSDLGIRNVTYEGFYAEDCGHAAWRTFDYTAFPLFPRQKSGVFVFAGGRNVKMTAKVKINSDYTTRTDWLGRTGYPGAGLDFVGAGLSGAVGSLIMGWGQNNDIEIILDGDVDQYFDINRSLSLGDTASSGGFLLPPTHALGSVSMWQISVDHVDGGAANYAVNSYAFNTAIDNADVSVVMKMRRFANFAIGVVGPDGTSTLSNVGLQFQNSTGRFVDGTATAWLASGNQVPVTVDRETHIGSVKFDAARIARGFILTHATPTLVNGANTGVATPTAPYIRYTGPTAAFTIHGIIAPPSTDWGMRVLIRNTTAQNMTIAHSSGTEPTDANRITTNTGADIVTAGGGSVELIYDAPALRWMVIGFNA